MTSKALTHQDYSVGWVCALKEELAAATVMLDEEHPDLPISSSDRNAYTLGSIGDHNIAIACLPEGDIGNNPAATVATRMTSTFPSIRFWLMVGIGGGVPPTVRLGDVVVSIPVYETPGVIQWDLGIALQDNRFRRIGALDKAPEALRTAIKKLRAQHERRGHDKRFLSILEDIRVREPFFASKYLQFENLEDVLFQADYNHDASPNVPTPNDGDKEAANDNDDDDKEVEENGVSNCRYCDRTKTVNRKSRQRKTEIHYGLIASGNQVVKDAIQRDEINNRLQGNVLCFEMEAAGITISHPCLVIRGICDYSDSHKNYQWQPYAAVAAAAVAKELLGVVMPTQVNILPPAAELLDEIKDVKHISELNLEATHKIDMSSALTKLPSVNEAAFDSFANELEPICHPETRIDLLAEINDWALDSQSKCIFWLNGMAGTGKSTISRTIARDFTNRRLLGASFFFKRGEGDRGNASKFITTIATQLVQKFSDLGPYLKKALETEPTISTKTMKEQFEKLIIGPLSELGRPLKALLVIDALDECENDSHIAMILHLLARVGSIKTAKLRLLVTSRPDLPVRLGFMKIPVSHRDFILHDVPPPVIKHDIHVFLRDELPKIRDKCEPPLREGISSNWPTERNTEALVNMAVPLFIFAATMCRFIGDIWDWDPVEKMDKILRYRSFKNLTQLETTYLPVLDQILQGNPRKSEKYRRIQEFRKIVGSIILLFEPLSSASLAVLLGISRTNIDRRLHTLHSVLRVPDDPKIPVRMFHLSFRDFLVDSENNESEFRIDEKEAHKKLAFCCIDLLSKTSSLREDICSLKKPGILRIDIDALVIEECLPAEVQYACRYWAHHLERGDCRISAQDKVHKFLDQRFLYWVEALSIIGRVIDSIGIIISLQNLLEVKQPSPHFVTFANLIKSNDNFTLKSFLNDAKHFLLKNREILNNAPLQLYSSAIVFAPETSIIRNRFKNHIPDWLRRLPDVEEAWSADVQILEGHLGRVTFVAFSSDGRLLASAADEGDDDKIWDATGVIKIWDAFTGDLRLSLEGHSYPISSVAFSSHDELLASASGDKTIKIWNTATGELHQTLKGHSSWVESVAFAPHDELLASGSGDRTIKIWNGDTGDLQLTLEGHSGSVESVAFAPHDELLASGSTDYTIKIWNAITGDLQSTLEGHSGPVLSVAFAPHDELLASGSGDRTIKIWNIITRDLKLTFQGHSGPVQSVAFSPHSELLASGSNDKTIKIWSIIKRDLLQTLHDPYAIDSIVFSPSSGLLISGCGDGTIKFWDVSMQDTQEAHEEETSQILALALSSNNKMIALSFRNGIIELWSTVTNDIQCVIKTHLPFNNLVTFSPDDTSIVSASSSPNSTVEFWDTAKGNLQRTIEEKRAFALAFSPDGKVLAISCGDSHNLWDLTSGIIQQTFKISRVASCIAFSSNGKLLASGNCGGITVWDVSTGKLLQISNVDGSPEKLWFHPENPFIFSNKGIIEIQGPKDRAHQPCQRDFVFLIHDWITWNEERVIWVPPKYRGQCFDFRDKMVAIGYESGLFRLVKIDFSK